MHRRVNGRYETKGVTTGESVSDSIQEAITGGEKVQGLESSAYVDMESTKN